MAARFAGCLLGAVCIALIIHLSNKSFRGCEDENSDGSLSFKNTALGVGTAAGLLAMLYPGAIGMSVFLLSEAIFCPLILASILSSARSIECKSNGFLGAGDRWMLAAGLFSGAACLARPSWSLWPAVLFPYLLLAMLASDTKNMSRGVWITWATRCTLFCLGVCLIMSPWWFRNYTVTGKFVPTTLQVGASLYDGWHPGATGSSDEGMNFVYRYLEEQRAEDEATTAAGKPLKSTFEWRADQRLKNAAIAWARENSSDAARLGLVKLAKTWSPLPVARELGSNSVRWIEAIGYSAIMGFAAIGIWTCRKWVGAWLFAMPCVYFALLHMFFIGSVRYRQPAVLVLCILGGVGMAVVLQGIRTRWTGTRSKFDGSIALNDVTADNSHP